MKALPYFHTPGPRVIYILPQSETEKILPMTISKKPSHLVRVLLGRIEFMTYAQEQNYLDLIQKQVDITQDETFNRFLEPKLRRLLDIIKNSKSITIKNKKRLTKKINSYL